MHSMSESEIMERHKTARRRKQMAGTPEEHEAAEDDMLSAEIDAYITMVAPRLDQYRWPLVPERPMSLPADDNHLLESLSTAGNGAAGKKFRGTFGAWRRSVMSAEAQARSNLEMLLYFARALQHAHEGKEAYHRNLLHAFVLEHYDLRLDTVPATRAEMIDLAEQTCRATSVLSNALLHQRITRRKPKRGGTATAGSLF